LHDRRGRGREGYPPNRPEGRQEYGCPKSLGASSRLRSVFYLAGGELIKGCRKAGTGGPIPPVLIPRNWGSEPWDTRFPALPVRFPVPRPLACTLLLLNDLLGINRLQQMNLAQPIVLPDILRPRVVHIVGSRVDEFPACGPTKRGPSSLLTGLRRPSRLPARAPGGCSLCAGSAPWRFPDPRPQAMKPRQRPISSFPPEAGPARRARDPRGPNGLLPWRMLPRSPPLSRVRSTRRRAPGPAASSPGRFS